MRCDYYNIKNMDCPTKAMYGINKSDIVLLEERR